MDTSAVCLKRNGGLGTPVRCFFLPRFIHQTKTTHEDFFVFLSVYWHCQHFQERLVSQEISPTRALSVRVAYTRACENATIPRNARPAAIRHSFLGIVAFSHALLYAILAPSMRGGLVSCEPLLKFLQRRVSLGIHLIFLHSLP